MAYSQRKITSVFAIVGISLASVAATALSNELSTTAYQQVDEDKPVVEEKKVKTKKTIKVITSGKPVVLESKKGRYVILKDHAHHAEHDDDTGKRVYRYSFGSKNKPHHEYYAEKTLEQVQQSLETVEKRLKKARKKAEKKALTVARDGLMIALKTLKDLSIRQMHAMKMRDGHDVAIVETLKDIDIYDGEISSMRVEVLEDMQGLRETIAEALGDAQLEIDLNGDVRGLRIESLNRGEYLHKGNTKERLEAIKRAENELKKARERLEKLLKEENSKEEHKD